MRQFYVKGGSFENHGDNDKQVIRKKKKVQIQGGK